MFWCTEDPAPEARRYIARSCSREIRFSVKRTQPARPIPNLSVRYAHAHCYYPRRLSLRQGQ